MTPRRSYRAGMRVQFGGRAWGIDGVEFWENDEKLFLKAVETIPAPEALAPFYGPQTMEAWADSVTFEVTESREPQAGEAEA